MRKTLHLNLHRKWFDMIMSGEKKEEYREVSPYWCSMLLLYKGEHKTRAFWKGFLRLGNKACHHSQARDLIYFVDYGVVSYKNFDSIIFSNGYAKNRDQFEISNKNLCCKYGRKEWGADVGKRYFVFNLGGLVKAECIPITYFARPVCKTWI